MSYEANLLKEVQKGAVYRFRTNGHFFLVTGFTRIQVGDDANETSDAVVFHRVEYIKIPQNNPALNQPKVGLRVDVNEQKLKRVRRADDFMDRFFLHEKAESRPKIVEISNEDGSFVRKDLGTLDADLVILDAGI